MAPSADPMVVVVGGGFAGVGCATELAQRGMSVTLVDRNNFHQFQPLLYQVAGADRHGQRLAPRRPPHQPPRLMG